MTQRERQWQPVTLGGDVPPPVGAYSPAAKAGLHVVTASPNGIELAWNAVSGDASLYGYEVLRGDASGGPYTKLALLTVWVVQVGAASICGNRAERA